MSNGCPSACSVHLDDGFGSIVCIGKRNGISTGRTKTIQIITMALSSADYNDQVHDLIGGSMPNDTLRFAGQHLLVLRAHEAFLAALYVSRKKYLFYFIRPAFVIWRAHKTSYV